MYGLQMLDSWLYDDAKPFIHVEANATFVALKKKVEEGYFEELVKKYLIENTQKSIFFCFRERVLRKNPTRSWKKNLPLTKPVLPKRKLLKLLRTARHLRNIRIRKTPKKIYRKFRFSQERI